MKCYQSDTLDLRVLLERSLDITARADADSKKRLVGAQRAWVAFVHQATCAMAVLIVAFGIEVRVAVFVELWRGIDALIP
uniref:hypothetical protein n=1 Tax=Rhizobium rhizogenes TaxID=359 RepID=UPI001910A768|nr:hypothetical protein [Rhizobium rhizogenes]